MTPKAAEAAEFRKIAWRLMPLLTIGYILNYLERGNIAFAALQMNQEVGLTPAQFGFGAGILSLGYYGFEIPSNIALYRFGARRWLARIMVTWGLVATACALIAGQSCLRPDGGGRSGVHQLGGHPRRLHRTRAGGLAETGDRLVRGRPRGNGGLPVPVHGSGNCPGIAQASRMKRRQPDRGPGLEPTQLVAQTGRGGYRHHARGDASHGQPSIDPDRRPATLCGRPSVW